MSADALPVRKSTRLPEFDYSQSGAYFVTICTRNRQNLFWRKHTVGAAISRPQTAVEPPLSQHGLIVLQAIHAITDHYPHISADKYVVMPNHIHLILRFSKPDGRIISAPTLSTVIGQMKRSVSKQIGQPIWQRSFHDHVIRGDADYQEIWEYIDNNPAKWAEDEFFTP